MAGAEVPIRGDAMAAESSAVHAGRGREHGLRDQGRDRDQGLQTGRGAPAGRGTHPGRGGGDQQASRLAGNQSHHQYVPILNSNKAEPSQQGADLDHQQLEQGALKKKRSFCFRCKSSGHVNENCKVNLDCVICATKRTPICRPSARF